MTHFGVRQYNNVMEIITRDEAITQGRTRYFTSQPCKHGHISERYTSTTGCVECLHPSFVNVEREARRDAKLKRDIARTKRMERFKIALYHEDVELYKAIVYSFSLAHEPALLPQDVLTKFKPQWRGDAMKLHAFRIFPQDERALIDMVRDLNWARLTPEQQTVAIANQGDRKDGWVPPPLRGSRA